MSSCNIGVIQSDVSEADSQEEEELTGLTLSSEMLHLQVARIGSS